MSQFYEAFFSDARERLSETELMLLGIQLPNIEHETMNAIFRAIHSIKGSTATFGFKQTTSLTHEFENVLDYLRNPETTGYSLKTEHIDTLLSVNDELIQQLAEYQAGQEPEASRTNSFIKRLQKLLHTINNTSENTQSLINTARNSPSNKTIYMYQIELIQKNEKDTDSLAESLSLLGQVTKRNTIDGKIIIDLFSTEEISTIKSICLFIVDLKDLIITVNRTQQIESHNSDQNNAFVTKPLEEPTYLAPGLITQALPTSIRVQTEKINLLHQLVNELSIAHMHIENSLDQNKFKEDHQLIACISQQSEKIKALSQVITSIRLISLDHIFARFPRMVRELGAQLNKKAILYTSSSTIELDQVLIERLIDPITHLLRNCLDHGIELPEIRLSQGKPEIGKLNLSAQIENETILIEISDDGAGLDRERIIEKAKKQNLDLQENISDSQVWDLIFEPGFTTALSITEISGRGVGMDIVKQNVSELGGTIQIHSIQGKGTAFTITLPRVMLKQDISSDEKQINDA